MSLNHFLKQGGEADFHSLRITRCAMTTPNMRAFCNDEGRVRQKLEQPSIIRRLSGMNRLLSITLYRWKMLSQKVRSLGQDQIRWPRVPSADLHLSQVAETEGKILFSLVFEKCERWVTLNWISWSLAFDRARFDPSQVIGPQLIWKLNASVWYQASLIWREIKRSIV